MTEQTQTPKPKPKRKPRPPRTARDLAAQKAEPKPPRVSGAGRHPVPLYELRADWRERAIEVASEGGSQNSMMLAMGIGHTVYNRLIREDEQFRQAMEYCFMLSEQWHEQRGQDMIKGRRGNPLVWRFVMENRFGWSQKVDTRNLNHNTDDRGRELTGEELKAELERRGIPTDALTLPAPEKKR